MNEYTAFAVAAVAIFATTGFICWLHARYSRSSGERESSVQVDDNAVPTRTYRAERQHRVCADAQAEAGAAGTPRSAEQAKEEKGEEVKLCQHG